MLCVPETAQVVHYARDQRAVCCATRAAGRPSPPSRPRPFRSANRALVTSEHWQNAARAAGFRLRLGGGTLRFGYDSLGASLRPPLHFSRSPTADRSQIIVIHGATGEFVNQPLASFRFANH